MKINWDYVYKTLMPSLIHSFLFFPTPSGNANVQHQHMYAMWETENSHEKF